MHIRQGVPAAQTCTWAEYHDAFPEGKWNEEKSFNNFICNSSRVNEMHKAVEGLYDEINKVPLLCRCLEAARIQDTQLPLRHFIIQLTTYTAKSARFITFGNRHSNEIHNLRKKEARAARLLMNMKRRRETEDEVEPPAKRARVATANAAARQQQQQEQVVIPSTANAERAKTGQSEAKGDSNKPAARTLRPLEDVGPRQQKNRQQQAVQRVMQHVCSGLEGAVAAELTGASPQATASVLNDVSVNVKQAAETLAMWGKRNAKIMGVEVPMEMLTELAENLKEGGEGGEEARTATNTKERLAAMRERLQKDPRYNDIIRGWAMWRLQCRISRSAQQTLTSLVPGVPAVDPVDDAIKAARSVSDNDCTCFTTVTTRATVCACVGCGRLASTATH
jgi:hypothetical protein